MRRHLKQLDQLHKDREDQVTKTWQELQRCRDKLDDIEVQQNSIHQQIAADPANTVLKERL